MLDDAKTDRTADEMAVSGRSGKMGFGRPLWVEVLEEICRGWALLPFELATGGTPPPAPNKEPGDVP